MERKQGSGHRMKKVSLASFLQGVGGGNEQQETYGHFRHDPASHHQSSGEYGGASRSLWIGNLDPNLSEEEIRERFETYGEVESLRLLPEKECAFVNYERLEDAIKAKENTQGTSLGNTILRVRFGKMEVGGTTAPSTGVLGDSHSSSSLWIGNVSSELDPDYVDQHLVEVFSPFGEIVFMRVLRQKNCAFINFHSEEEAMNAKKALSGYILGKLPIKIGFAKPLAAKQEQPMEPTLSSDTGGLDTSMWMKSTDGNGNLDDRRDVDEWNQMKLGFDATLRSSSLSSSIMRESHGVVSSHLYRPVYDDPSVESERNHETLMNDSWLSKPSTRSSSIYESNAWILQDSNDDGGSGSGGGLHEMGFPQNGWHPSSVQMNSRMESTRKKNVLSDRESLGFSLEYLSLNSESSELGHTTEKLDEFSHEIPELGDDIGSFPNPQRLKDIRRKLDGHSTQRDVDAALNEFFEYPLEMVTDSIGNIVFQKIVEKCSDQQKLRILQRLAPHLASISISKNGTWAVQKIIEHANSTAQSQLVVSSLRPYTVKLMEDRFGNYVIQSCLHLGARIQFIIEAMSFNCLEIALNKFGCRAMKSCLESHYLTVKHQTQVFVSILRNAMSLMQDPNGVLVIHWLLESRLEGTSMALGRVLRTHFAQLSMNKFASSVLLHLIEEPSIRDEIMREVFEETSIPLLLQDSHAVSVLHKILMTSRNDDEKVFLVKLLRLPSKILSRAPHHHSPQFKRLLDDMASIPINRHDFEGNRDLSISSSSIGIPDGTREAALPSLSPFSLNPESHETPLMTTYPFSSSNSTSSLLETRIGSSYESRSALKPLPYSLLDPFYTSSANQVYASVDRKPFQLGSSDVKAELSKSFYQHSVLQETQKSSSFSSGGLYPSPRENIDSNTLFPMDRHQHVKKECPICRTQFFKMSQGEFDLHVDDCYSKASLVNIDNFA